MRLWLAAGLMFGLAQAGSVPDDGGVSYDNRGQELLESVDVPPVKGAPFSMTLVTEWSRPMANGGSYTVTNTRPMKRDAAGRIYQERWLLSPKGSKIASRMSWIQIADPVAKTLLECSAAHKVCELEKWRGWDQAAPRPDLARTGALASGHGAHTHQDLGAQYFAGLPVHGYKETTTLNAGVMGNDLPMVTTREFLFSVELGFDLRSVVETPRLGRQVFTVTEIATGEPEAKWFGVPDGYRVVDVRGPQ